MGAPGAEQTAPVPTVSPSPEAKGLAGPGDEGRFVENIQRKLAGLGYAVGPSDGIYGPWTEEAVVAFQMRAGIPATGAVDSDTLGALKAAFESPPESERESNADEPGPGVVEPGDEGSNVASVQRRLEKLGYWVGAVDGVYGELTEQAVLAFQGAEGLTRDGIFGPATRAALGDAGRLPARKLEGDGIEIDEARQLLLIVRGGSVKWAFHTSTGTEDYYVHPDGNTYLADTPDGKWTISRQVDGWRNARLGRLWRPKFFHRDGIAIHGFPTVPFEPASHGCARVTMQAMDFIWRYDLAPVGSVVWVY